MKPILFDLFDDVLLVASLELGMMKIKKHETQKVYEPTELMNYVILFL